MSVRSQRTGGLLLLAAQSVAAPRQTCQRVISGFMSPGLRTRGSEGAACARGLRKEGETRSHVHTSARAGGTLLDATIYRSLRQRRWEGDGGAPGVRDAMRVLASAGIQAHRVIICGAAARVRLNDPQPGLCAGMRGASRRRRRRRGWGRNGEHVFSLHAPPSVSHLPPTFHLCVTTRGRARAHTCTYTLSYDRHFDHTGSKQGMTSVRNEDGRRITWLGVFFCTRLLLTARARTNAGARAN